MKIDEFCKWPFVHDPVLDPKGEKLIFSLTRANLDKNKYESELWICQKNKEADDYDIRPLTSGKADSSPLFFPCGKKILFTSQRVGADSDKGGAGGHKENIFYCLPLDGGEARPLFSLNLNVSRYIFIDDHRLLIQGSYPFAASADWTELDGLPAWLNGAGYVDGMKTGLFVLDLDRAVKAYKEKGEDLTKILEEAKSPLKSTRSAMKALEEADRKKGLIRLTPGDFSLGAWDLAQGQLYYSGTENKDPLHLTQEVYLISDLEKVLKSEATDKGDGKAKSKLKVKPRLLLKDVGVWAIISKVDSSSVYLLYSDMKKQGINQNACLATLDPKGKLSPFTDPEADIDFANSLGSDARFGGGCQFKACKDGLYFIETEADRVSLKKVALDGTIKTIVDGPTSVESFDLTEEGSDEGPLFYLAMDKGLAEIYVRDEDGERQISSFSKEIEPPLIEHESFTFHSNADDIRGFVLTPAGYDPDKAPTSSYPALLWIHGGPKTILGPALYHEMQFFANEGYFVFFTNPHGSSGRGDAFSNIRAGYGSRDYEDLMTFTDKFLEKYPAADPKRLGVLGGSYGGFMTNWIIGHTDRFAAANSQRSISNWISFYGVSDIGFYFSPDQTFADPKALTSSDQYLTKAWDQSPLKYADKVKTPTLFIHAEEDYRCPLEQGMQMYTALKVRGVDSRMVVFKGENHELSRSGRPKGRIKRLNEIKNWFDKYLKK